MYFLLDLQMLTTSLLINMSYELERNVVALLGNTFETSIWDTWLD